MQTTLPLSCSKHDGVKSQLSLAWSLCTANCFLVYQYMRQGHVLVPGIANVINRQRVLSEFDRVALRLALPKQLQSLKVTPSPLIRRLRLLLEELVSTKNVFWKVRISNHLQDEVEAVVIKLDGPNHFRLRDGLKLPNPWAQHESIFKRGLSITEVLRYVASIWPLEKQTDQVWISFYWDKFTRMSNISGLKSYMNNIVRKRPVLPQMHERYSHYKLNYNTAVYYESFLPMYTDEYGHIFRGPDFNLDPPQPKWMAPLPL